MKLFLDTNVLVDLLDDTRPNAEISERLDELCRVRLIDAVAAAFSFPTVLYTVRKNFTLPEMKKIFGSWGCYIKFEGLKHDDLARGFEMGFSDYEDALQAIIAERVGARYIVTWNKRDYAKSPVRAITPKELFQDIIVGMKI